MLDNLERKEKKYRKVNKSPKEENGEAFVIATWRMDALGIACLC